MKVYDHTHPLWRNRYGRHGRTNGAYTYSRDIVKHHVPVWRELLNGDASVATCAIVPGATVQYLHTRMHPELSDETKVFVTTYKDLAVALGNRGLWIPNAVDPEPLPTHKPENNWIYYGNLVGPKQAAFKKLHGLDYDVLSCNVLKTPSGNRRARNQAEALDIVSTYRYGIGVGRCALEMLAIGLKVMIFGKDFGGIVCNKRDLHRQAEANWNGNVVTGAGSIEEAFERIDDSICMSSTLPSADVGRRITQYAAQHL